MTATPARQPQIFKAIKIEKPYEAIALIDGWLCIKYLDGGEESLSTFADVLKGDIIRFGHATHTSPPAPAQFKCPDCERLFDSDIHLGIHHYTDHAIKHDAQVAKAAREDALNEFMMAIEYRFEDTNNGRGVVGTIRGLKESLRAQQGGESE